MKLVSFASRILLLFSAAKLVLCCFSHQCADLAGVLEDRMANTTIGLTEYIHAGTNLTLPPTHPTCEGFNSFTGFNSVVDFSFCRVQMVAHTGPASAVGMEVWLPLNWTGRFMAVGNGGLGGCIWYSDMAYGAGRGFAVVGTNNGHDGNTGEPFLNKPGVVEDFAYRAIHTGAVLGKQVTEAMYGEKHTKAYYMGCSTGGRQGFMEAQNFPEDFDGIVAGAPAFDWFGLMVASARAYTLVGPPGSPTFLTPAQWQLVVNDTLRQCDALDGHVDTVIEDPELCQYRPEALICGATETETETETETDTDTDADSDSDSNCLTSVQAETVRKVLSPTYDMHAQLVYPRMQPGVDSSGLLLNGQPFPFALDWLRYVVYGDPSSYDGNLTLEDIEAARHTEAYGINAFSGDLSRARDSGTKVLHYHGLQDGLISSDNSARYYNLVARTMGLRSADLDQFYRYFRISGLGHCWGGTGAFNIGTRLTPGGSHEAEANVLAAIVRWVEEGEAPEHILGTAFTDAAQTKVKFQRRHCRYPRRNAYKGKGDPDSVDSWECIY